jgi:SET domain-containing protein
MRQGYFISAKIMVGQVRGKGRGVLARSHIAAEELIEYSPMLTCTADEIPKEGHSFSDFMFHCGDGLALGLGYASLYNHADEPNCAFHIDAKREAIGFTALRRIAAGEELTIDYGIPLWFLKAGAQFT